MGANTRSKRSCSHNPPVDIISIPKEPPVHIISINNDWTINHLSRQRDRDGAKGTKVKNDISKYRTRRQRRHDPREYNNNNNLLMEIGASSALSLLKAAFLSLCLLLAYSCTNHIRSLKIKYRMSSGINTPTTSNTKNKVMLHIPSGLDYGRRRSLSLNLGEGKCLWQVRDFTLTTRLSVFVTHCLSLSGYYKASSGSNPNNHRFPQNHCRRLSLR